MSELYIQGPWLDTKTYYIFRKREKNYIWSVRSHVILISYV